MKSGKTVVELWNEVERQQNLKRDFIVPTSKLEMVAPGKDSIPMLKIALDETRSLDGGSVEGVGNQKINSLFHSQVGEELKIPSAFYDRMRGNHPDVLAYNVNTLWEREEKRRMVRTLDGTARAYLSDRYRTLDNYDLLEKVLPVIHDTPGLKVRSSEITDKNIYLKIVSEKIEGEVRTGDVVRAGFLIKNSEVGGGAVRVSPLIERLVCLNGMVVEDMGMKKYHVGRLAEDMATSYEVFTDATRKADDEAFWMKVVDVVRSIVNEDIFNRILNNMRLTTEVKLGNDYSAAVEVTSRRMGLTSAEKSAAIRHLAESMDFTGYGVLNSVTRMAQDVKSYDRSTYLEESASKMLDYGKHDWDEIVEASRSHNVVSMASPAAMALVS